MTRLLIILFLVPVLAYSQYKPEGGIRYDEEYTVPCTVHFNMGKLGVVSSLAVQNFLERDGWIDLTFSTLELLDSISSPSGWHFNFKQLYNGVEIYGAGLKVNVGKDGRIRSFIDNTIKINRRPNTQFPVVEMSVGRNKNVTASRIFFVVRDELRPSIRLEIRDGNLVHYEQIMLDAETILYRQDLNRYFMTDSIVAAKVFFPDPLSSSGQVYGGVYADNSDSDNTELNLERFDVNMVVDFVNDTFRLSSPFVEIQEFSNPGTVPATSTVANFEYTRSENEFEDVNCFYHLSSFQNYMQSLGFNLVNYQIGVDAHAFTADNSMFSYPKLYFGDGCVDDGEDADVIVHEYTHAITASAAPNTWVGSERKALDEGAGDYLATSYTRSLNPFNWELVFGWDGNNACWPGRTAVTTKTYPSGLSGSIHADGEIWNAALMQIWEVLGRETTDQIFLQSLYSWAQNMTMTDAAYMFLDADSLLNGGVNYVTCYYWLEKRGFLPPLPFFSGTDGNGEFATCNGVCDASAVVIPMSGIAPFTYVWKDSLGNFLGQNTDTVTGLCAGKYTVFITDSAGDTATVNVKTREPGALVSSVNTSGESCSFCGDGIASAVVSGGTPPFSYLWNDVLAQTTKNAMGLDSGWYSVTIVDANGCQYADSGLVGVNAATVLGMVFLSSTNLTCNALCEGVIQAAAYGGVPPYTYSWNDTLFQTTSQASNLCAGTYAVVIADAIGDSIIDSLTLTEPIGIVSSSVTQPDSGGGQGTVSVIVTGGVQPLTYTWDDSQAQTTSLASGLVAGVYTVTWVDSAGCTGTATDTVALFTTIAELGYGEISIFPNPTDGKVFIKSELPISQMTVKIINIIGQPVYIGPVENAGSIDLSEFTAGFYHILVLDEGVVLQRKNLVLH